jgi:hypothetical protein
MNDSSTGGALLPTVDPLDDAALDAVLVAMVAGVGGIASVRPRWQAQPLPQPAPGTDWAAVGIIRRKSLGMAWFQHRADNLGDDSQAHEELEIMASVYGANRGRNAARVRDGLYIPQNREALASVGISVVDTGDIVSAPELFAQQWIGRVDLTITLRRELDRTYQVLNLVSADGVIHSTTSPAINWSVQP